MLEASLAREVLENEEQYFCKHQVNPILLYKQLLL
jgi:hypothetical protein